VQAAVCLWGWSGVYQSFFMPAFPVFPYAGIGGGLAGRAVVLTCPISFISGLL
jgi:hypothetical protein